MVDALSHLWHRLFDAQSAPALPIVIATAAVALIAVAIRPVWRLTRNFVTIAHEGGHALAAVVTGRRLSGIRLHSDTSGLTLSRGRPSGPGMVITGLAGYLTPPLMGMVAAGLLAVGRITLLLWICLILLPLMLIMIRNVYGAVSVIVTMAIIFAISWYTPANVQGAFAFAFAWFLLLGGARGVFELQQSRYRRQAPNSDADQIARITHVPALVWVGFFAIIAIVALGVGTRWLLNRYL